VLKLNKTAQQNLFKLQASDVEVDAVTEALKTTYIYNYLQ